MSELPPVDHSAYRSAQPSYQLDMAASADLLGQPDENALGAADVAEPIHVFVLDHFVDDLRAVSAEPRERVVEVVHGEHDAQVAQSVHGGVPVIGDDGRRDEPRELDPAMAVRRAHHGDLAALVAESSDAPRPVSFDHGSAFELEAQLGEKRDGGVKRFDDDADVVHPLERHAAILATTSGRAKDAGTLGQWTLRPS